MYQLKQYKNTIEVVCNQFYYGSFHKNDKGCTFVSAPFTNHHYDLEHEYIELNHFDKKKIMENIEQFTCYGVELDDE